MSDKMECPACHSYTSSIAYAFQNGSPCPECSLPAEAALAFEIAQARGADEQLIRKAAEATARADRAERVAARLRAGLEGLKREIEELLKPDDGKPLW